MANLRINNLRVRAAAIDNVVKEGRYDTEDITPMELEYVRRHAPRPRATRSDLSRGDLVVVLEGTYAARRGVFLAQAAENKAVVFVLSASGSPAVFKIDERYLFKLSTRVELSADLKVDTDGLFESEVGEGERVDAEGGGAEDYATRFTMDAISKVRFMRSYLSEDFEVDHSKEFYSQKY